MFLRLKGMQPHRSRALTSYLKIRYHPCFSDSSNSS